MRGSKTSQVLERFTAENMVIPALIGRNTFVFGDSNKYEVDVAQDLSSKMEAYELVYRLYRNNDMGYAVEDPSKMWYSIINASPLTNTLIVRDTQTRRIVATLTVVVDSDLGLPSEVDYPEQIEGFRKKKSLCAELISLGFDEDVRGSSEMLVQLFKFAYLIYRGVYHATDLLIMIKPKHSFFYENKLMFKAIGETVNCKKINNNPVKLFHLDLVNAQALTEEYLRNKNEDKKKSRCLEIFKSFVKDQYSMRIMKIIKNKVKFAEMSCRDIEVLFLEEKNILNQTRPDVLLTLAKMFKVDETKKFLEFGARFQFEAILPL